MIAELEHEGGRIAYLEAGGGGGLGTLVLLHAFPLAAAMWEPQLHSAPAGWRVLAPDLRGLGRSSPGSDGARVPAVDAALSIDDYARDVLALLDGLGVGDAVFCGLSMGGYVALALCRLARPRVRGLVLADTRADADSDAARAGREAMLATLASGGAPAVADAMLPKVLGRTTLAGRPALVEQVRALAAAQPAPGVGAAIVRLRNRPDATSLLAGLGCPALVVAGEEDEATGPAVARDLHARLPGSDLALIRGAGHLSSLEQPDGFDRALHAFLAGRFGRP